MRLDKFLKVSRIIKRRTVAKGACNGDNILVNGKIAKPSTEVSEGDNLEIHFAKNVLKVKIVDLKSSNKKEDALSMYEVNEES